MQGGRRIERYVLGPEIASGGMASVHLARMLRAGGFGKTVAIKRLHSQYVRDPEFVTLFLDEARVTSALNHPNIVMTLDVLEDQTELYLVMEYVHGASLSQIQRGAQTVAIPTRIIAGIVSSMLDGLHAAHEAKDETGAPLRIVHRDVSPQNILVTFEGVTKIADFGIARAAGRMHATQDGSVMGKIGYMAPEQLLGGELTARTDLYSAGVVLWEALTGRRLIDFATTAENLRAIVELEIAKPSAGTPSVPPEVDDVVMRALSRAPADRFASAKEMGAALRKAVEVAPPAEIADWLRAERPHLLEGRESFLADLQRAIGASAGTAVRSSPGSDPSIESATVTYTRAISSDSHQGPPPPARWLFPTLTIVFALGMAGVTFFMIARIPRAPAAAVSNPPALPSSSATAERTAPAATTATAPVEPSGPSAPITSIPASASASAAPTPAAPRKCRIVPSTDGFGHTKFKEVCP